MNWQEAQMADRHSGKGPRNDRWYLSIMSPNTKGEKFAWLDPTSIYINGAAFHDLLDARDSCAPGER